MSAEPIITPESKQLIEENSEKMKHLGYKGREKMGELGKMTKERAGEYIQGAHELSEEIKEKTMEMTEEAKEKAGEAYKKALERGGEMRGHTKTILENAAESFIHAKDYVTQTFKNTSKIGKEKIEHIGEIIKQRTRRLSQHKTESDLSEESKGTRS